MSLSGGFKTLGALAMSPAPGSVPFAPDDLPNLWIWLKADSIVGLSDDDYVNEWQDSSTNGRDATNSGGTFAQPVYKTNVLNGLPVLRYTGVQHLEIPIATLAQPFTIIALVMASDVGVDYLNVARGGDGGAFYLVGEGLGYWNIYAGSVLSSEIAPVAGEFSMAVGVYNSTSSVIAVEGDTTPTEGDAGTNNMLTSEVLYIGGSHYPWEFWRGDIAEYLIYTSALSTGDRQKVEGYLAHKWGRTSALPADHPYKTEQP